jgi:hypothetical protein
MMVLKRAVPNEAWQLVLEFEGPEYRLFDTAIVREEKGWQKLAYPQHVKRFTMTSDALCWTEGGCVSAEYLYQRSTPLQQPDLERQVLRLSYQNQAPTSEDKSHHVYGVYFSRFGKQAFQLEESIGGGMAERGGSRSFSVQELLAWPAWRDHFQLSGCAWAIPIVESVQGAADAALDLLVSEACLRNGLPQST